MNLTVSNLNQMGRDSRGFKSVGCGGTAYQGWSIKCPLTPRDAGTPLARRDVHLVSMADIPPTG